MILGYAIVSCGLCLHVIRVVAFLVSVIVVVSVSCVVFCKCCLCLVSGVVSVIDACVLIL